MPRRGTEKQFLGRFALTFAMVAAGFFSAPAAPNYFTRTWQVEQGLPQNKVTAVVQTRDGYLWVGTYNGLARFDGVRFTVFDENNTPELRSSRVTSLFEAADGTLWIGTESGDVSQYKDSHFASVPVRANWGDGKIYAITADEAGDVWLMNEAGELARARDGKVLSPPPGSVTNVVSLTRSDGTARFGSIGRDGCRFSSKASYCPLNYRSTGSKTYRRISRELPRVAMAGFGWPARQHPQMERRPMGRRPIGRRPICRRFGRRAVGIVHRCEFPGNFLWRAGGRDVRRRPVAGFS